MTIRSIPYILLFSFLPTNMLLAQGSPRFPAPASMPQFQRINPADDIAKARQFEQLGRNEEAAALYERVLRVDPENTQALNALPRLYALLQQYDKAAALLKTRIEKSPQNIVFRRMLAETLFKGKRVDEAKAQCDEILKVEAAGDRGIRIVAMIYTQHGYLDDAVNTYIEGRARIDMPDAYAIELARLYTTLVDIPHAIEEYIRWVILQPNQFAMVDERIEELVGQSDPAMVEAAILSALQATPSRIEPLKLLGNFYLRRERPGEALARYHQVEALNGNTGVSLLEFAAWCERERFYKEALNAYQEIISKPLQRNVLARATLGVSRSLLALDRADEAFELYQQVVTRYPRTPENEEAMYQIAELQLIHYHEPHSALTAYRSLLAVAPRTSRRADIMFRIADCHLIRRSITDAVVQYTLILDPQKSGLSGDNIQERARYHLAEMALYQGDIEEALNQFNETAGLFPGGAYANDALAWSLLIQEAQQAGEGVIEEYIQARLLEKQYRKQEALDAYKIYLNSYPKGPISDLAILEIGFILNDLEKPHEAIAAFRDLIERYPDSRHAPAAQHRIAETYETHLQNIPQSIAEYETVLVNYPDYIRNDAIRRKIRTLASRHRPQP